MSDPPRLPGSGRAWWSLALFGLLLAAVLGGAAKLAGLSTAAAVALAAVGGAVPAALKMAQGELDRRRARQQSIDRVTAGVTGDRLTLAGVSLTQLGVQPAVRSDVDYIERDQQSAAVEAIKVARRVLIVGPSMAGKSRLAASTAREALGGGSRVYLPRKADDLHELLLSQASFDDSVLWLDDLDEFASTSLAADLTALRDRHPSVAVVATIRTSQLQHLQSDKEIKPVGHDIPAWFGDAVWLDYAWSEAELDRLAATRSGQEVLEDARTYGLGCYLAGAPLVDDRIRLGRNENPVGLAVVQAAADWRTVGLEQPITAATLTSLIPAYAELKHTPSAEDQVKTGIAWATQQLNQTVSLLHESHDGYQALDRVVDRLTTPDIPAPLWQAALVVATLEEASRLSVCAYVLGQISVAKTALERVASKTRDPSAMYNLGVMLAESNPQDLGEARGWWQQAADAGHPNAAYNLAVTLQQSNPQDPDVGRHYEQAAQAGHSDAAFRLGVLLQQSHDSPNLDEARRYWQQAADAGVPEAAYNLGLLLQGRNPPDLVGARRYYEQAAKASVPDAAYNLGLLLQRFNPPELAGACRCYQQAIAAGVSEAAYDLGLLLQQWNPINLHETRRYYQQAVEAGAPNSADQLRELEDWQLAHRRMTRDDAAPTPGDDL